MADKVTLKPGEEVVVQAEPGNGEPPPDNPGITIHDGDGGVAEGVTDVTFDGFPAVEQTEPGHVTVQAPTPSTGLAGVAVQKNGNTVVPNAETIDFSGTDWSISRDDKIARVRYMGSGNGQPAGHDAYVNVARFGAVGDEQTDDGPALQEALDSGAGLFFDKRYRSNQPLWLKKNTTLLGVGDSRITFHNPAGGIGVSPSAPPLQYIRMDGLELINRTGNGKVILLSTGDMADHIGYPTGPNHSIDFCIISRMKMINGRVKLNSKRDRLWFKENLIESISVPLHIYALAADYGDGGLDNSYEYRAEDGYWIEGNNIHVKLAPPEVDGFGGDVDLIKLTGNLGRIRLRGNEIICLNGHEVEAQVDSFGAGGGADMSHNTVIDCVFHHKQNGKHGGLIHIDMFKGGRIDKNTFIWRSGVAGFHHGCAFIRGGGFSSVSGNIVDLDVTGRAVQCFTFDNTAPAVGTGWGSGSPVQCDFSHNMIEIRGRKDHLAMQIQGSGQGQPYGFGVHANNIRAPKGQSRPTVDLGPLQHSSITGNVDPFGPKWNIPPGCEHAANVFDRIR